jgi:glycosyltransferase involved in cell wall biosynthesis
MTTLISVVVPVYNGEKYITEAIDSIIHQEYYPLEIIVVDDGSTDGTPELIYRYDDLVRYFYQENQGPSVARNRGITESKGQFLAFLDSDDLWPSGKLETQASSLLKESDLDVVTGYTSVFQSKDEISKDPEILKDGILSVQLGSALFRKSVFDKVGLFDEELRYSEDQDWFLRACEMGIRKEDLEVTTLYHRRHENNMTDKAAAHGYQLTKVLKKSLDRRRQNSNGAIKSLPSLSDFAKKKQV